MLHRIANVTSREGVRVLLVATAIAATVAALALLDPDPFAEGATVERSTAVLLFMTAALLVVANRAGGWRRRWHVIAAALLLALREQDFDKAFLSEGVLQLRLYTGEAPVVEKLLGAGTVALVLWVAVRIIRRDLPTWLRGVSAGRTIPLALLGAGIAVAVAKLLDGAERKLAPFGVTLPPEAPRILGALEESLEFGFALVLLVSVLLWWRAPARRDRSR